MNDDAVTTAFPVDDNDQLDAALAELEAALESSDKGRVEDVLRRYPGCETELASYLENRTALDDIVAPLREAVSGVVEPPNIPGYRVLGLHDEGGMGLIYRAHYERLDEVVALKVMRDNQPVSGVDLRRFQTEARCASRLKHEFIITVHDIFGVDRHPAYYAMELVRGQSLKEHLAEFGTFHPKQAAEFMWDIADAMASAHLPKKQDDHEDEDRPWVVHRDLKPGNILIVRNDDKLKPRIIDFGLAKCENVTDSLAEGAFVGTPNYCSPEQARGEAYYAGPAADVYSLGAMLYEMLIGRPPLQGASYEETLRMVSEREPIPLRLINDDIPRDLETICMRCLQKDPADRYSTAKELRDDLDRFLKGHAIISPQVPSSIWDRLFGATVRETISQIGPGLRWFQALYTSCIIGLQILLLLNWGEPLAWLLGFGSLALLFPILKTDGSTGSLPTNPAERLLWSIWAGAIVAHFMLAVAMRLSFDYVEGFNRAFAVTPFLTGMAYFITGANFWKVNLVWGLLWMVLGVITATLLPSPWAPSAYIAFSCACTAHMLIDQRVRSAKIADQAEKSASAGA